MSLFDVYIIPMLNIDGVYLGNYRTNAYGYDMNRHWQN
jgi:murein tripeptide amidase MpaA